MFDLIVGQTAGDKTLILLWKMLTLWQIDCFYVYVAGYLENLKGGNMIKYENTIDLLIMNNYTLKDVWK